ncbi:LacI family transcriptional regulator [Asaia sp. W19]|uniref:LacI family DNA-binding transcriptional regulator n=1 Tax=unclassified Asaia TaxID=2685023 RepID=UPI000F8F1CEE|nr:LacI family DNA-binding transcriptional regulator [Asaia sp. W19]RUT25336.1 LacI family transcriptional regulator [Asaia sp. W19]
MSYAHPLKDIARQAGVGLATVDRVLHDRAGVRTATRRRVHQAIEELSRQTLEASLHGSRLVIDLVMEAPNRFSSAVHAALESQLAALMPVAMRVRAHLGETATGEEIASILARLRRRGSNGVLLKAPDHPAIRAEIRACADARIPVLTLVTDLPDTPRHAYVGMDNQAAGATAAWLISGWMHAPIHTGKAVLVVISSYRFLGEEEREVGFRRALAERAPHLSVLSLGEGRGLDWQTYDLVEHCLKTHPEIEGIYSIGGGNRAIAKALERCGRQPAVFIAHDLDRDNQALLTEGTITAVLHHDLGADMLQACQILIEANRLRPPSLLTRPSPVQIITPVNMPPNLRKGT